MPNIGTGITKNKKGQRNVSLTFLQLMEISIPSDIYIGIN